MTITDEMVERAAKAILIARYVPPDGEWDRCSSEDRNGAIDEARAALEAALSGKDRTND